MPRHALYSLTLLVGLGLLAWPSRSHAGTVVSDSGATVITVGGKRDRLSGQYRSRVGGVTWEGSFEANARSRGTYLGTFSDRPNTEPINQPQIFCVGDVSLKLSQRGRFDPTGLEVTWQVTGGKGCESVGQRFTTILREALPKADRQGNYQDGNARTYDSLGQKLIWPEWEVVAADGKLNCRATPNGRVTFTFRSGERLNRMTASRDSHFQLDDRSQPWLWISPKQCYVRANVSLIAPLSDTPWD
jgi:hypothetical protein